MCSHVTAFLGEIKTNYLGEKWEREMQAEFQVQAFRQKGYESEKPTDFLSRRAIWSRMLTTVEEGGIVEVEQILKAAPIPWLSILQVDSIRTFTALHKRASDNEKKLIYEAHPTSSRPSSDSLIPLLKSLGVSMPRLGSKAEAHDVEVTERSEALDSEVGNSTKSTGSSIEFTGEGAILRDVYAVFKQFKRQPPKGGYPFPKRDDVKTKLGRAPPSPCKCCGSQYHWDPECPEYDTYQERRRQKAQERSAHSVALETFDSQDPERAYDAGYQVLIAQRAAEYATQDFERASSGLGLVGKEKNTPLMTAPAKSKSPE
ncbi:hypothetical protein BDZ89DRAFT_958111 [Hymenopellis radicata]|nr:hypothetical protein BDZ89DRAFT_958111 [Hymenopellis radicata]